ncbi:glycosyltransferase family 4 protein [Taibaiella koreensis]|uniref:glycosyltransferase family 4 protein n=1 Tax=Taibaiella koreensis TaxID=1268548 RepID=UPI000E59E214|nr:glycosyltransferase family 1 protein [Taibaiella koreensis]
MKHIVFDCERMKYSNTGLYHYCLNLGLHIARQQDPAREQMAFFIPPNAVPAFQGPVLYQHPLRKFLMPALRSFDIWHGTYQNSDYLPFRNRRIKVVLSIHDLNFLYEPKSKAKKERYLRHLQANIDRSDAIVCVSRFCYDDVQRHCDTGNKQVYTIHNGTNHLEQPSLFPYSYKPARPFLFSLGTLCAKKNFHVLLPLLRQQEQMELLIAGPRQDSDYESLIHRIASDLGVSHRLRMLGNISENEKSWYYHNCYAFVLPSLAEGFGLTVMEAMSVGKPVFLSGRTALPEIGRDAAFYFHDFSEDHMNSVFSDGMARYRLQEMRDQIQKRSESFCWKKAATAYLEVYRTLY